MMIYTQERFEPKLPEWLKQQIQSITDRYQSLHNLEIKPHPFGETLMKIEAEFPELIDATYTSIGQAIGSPEETAAVLYSMERLVYPLIVLELSRGINPAGWKVTSDKGDNLVIIAHPNFSKADEFSERLRDAFRATRRKIEQSGVLTYFGLPATDQWKKIVFLVEDADGWQITGTRPIKGRQEMWWVSEVGDITVYYSKGRENLSTYSLLLTNRFHEFIHSCQQRVLHLTAFAQLYNEFSLLEGMANWWAPIFIREGEEKDFLYWYLCKDRFMEEFLQSRELISRVGHRSVRYPWNAVFTGMLFQKIGALLRIKEGLPVDPQHLDLKKFDYSLVQAGLQLVTKHLAKINELVKVSADNLTKRFIEGLIWDEFGVDFNFEEFCAYYDTLGYNFALSILEQQPLTKEEKQELERQKERYLQKIREAA